MFLCIVNNKINKQLSFKKLRILDISTSESKGQPTMTCYFAGGFINIISWDARPDCGGGDRPKSAQDTEGRDPVLQGDAFLRGTVHWVPDHTLQLPRLPAGLLLVIELHWSQEDQFPSLPFGRDPDRPPAGFPEEAAAEKVSRAEQVGQPVPDDRGRRDNQVRHQPQGGLRQKVRKGWLALHQVVDLVLICVLWFGEL